MSETLDLRYVEHLGLRLEQAPPTLFVAAP